jgi:uncharacterized repeat protein (TIGR01451 family)
MQKEKMTWLHLRFCSFDPTDDSDITQSKPDRLGLERNVSCVGIAKDRRKGQPEMSRYVFIAATALFVGMLIILAIAVAQIDQRKHNTPQLKQSLLYENPPAYPISVPSTAFGPDGSIQSNLLDSSAQGLSNEGPLPPLIRGNDRGMPLSDSGSSRSPAESNASSLASYTSTSDDSAEVSSNPGSLPSNHSALASPNGIPEPPRFDRSRIVRPRNEVYGSTPALLPPSNRSAAPSALPIAPPPFSAGLPSPIGGPTDRKPAPFPSTTPNNPAATPSGLPELAPMAGASGRSEPSSQSFSSPTQEASTDVRSNERPPSSIAQVEPNDGKAPVDSAELRSSTQPNLHPVSDDRSKGTQRPVASMGAPLPLTSLTNESSSVANLPILPREELPQGLPNGTSSFAAPPSFPVPTAPSPSVPSPSVPSQGSSAAANTPANDWNRDPPSLAPARDVGSSNPSGNSMATPPGALSSNGSLSSNTFSRQPSAGLGKNPLNASGSQSVVGQREAHSGNWSLASDAPGNRQFDGSQNPSLEIQKRAPLEVQVGVPATFTAIVRNVGNSTAFDVQVTDAIPKGSRLLRTLPDAERVGADGLLWRLGELTAGQESTISMELIPESEGEIGSVASIKFEAQASVRTISTQPRVSVKQSGPAELLGGASTTIIIDVTNTGTGTARDVQLEEDVPPLFRHGTGAKALLHPVGDLAPGETQRFEIELTALAAGKANNVVRATATNSASSESLFPIEIKAPKLQLHLVGPRIRHLERPAPYEAIIENTGTAVARKIYIVARLPRGMNYISATNEGTYLPDQHSVAWYLEELAAGTRAKTEVSLLPVEEGKFVLLMTSDAEGTQADPVEREVQVEGQSELTFNIDDDNDPIETQGVTTYSIQITNIGTRPDANVLLSVELPEGAELEQVHSPLKYQSNGRLIVFTPLPTLAPKDQVTIKVSVRHGREGTQIIRASLKSQLRPAPVVKDESTQVYQDR